MNLNRTSATRDDWRALARYCLMTEGVVVVLLVIAVGAVHLAKAFA